MAILTTDCPHCPARSAAFTIWAFHPERKQPKVLAVAASCPGCGQHILVRLMTMFDINPQNRPGDLGNADNRDCKVLEILPSIQQVSAPANTPTAAANAFVEAAANRRDGRASSASGMYRRAMELALKEFSPDIEAWKIEKRIDKLATEGRITQELREWAHEIRIDGNGGMHDMEESTMEKVDQMHHLCEVLLTYLFTLPAHVRATRERRDRASGVDSGDAAAGDAGGSGE